jgi:Flp pilus assembly protein TadD
MDKNFNESIITDHRIHNRRKFRVYARIAVLIILIICTTFVYWPTRDIDFISFDDNDYVVENPHVRSGLSKDGIYWAFNFTDKDKTYWHPLTWLSHMLDVHLFGMNPGQHHFSNVLIHIANTLLLFLLLNRITGALWRSAIVAALFAVHPINVDSVAWISQRKNVLSTLFWMITLGGYVFYALKPNSFRYLAVVIAFILGLLAKPMIVTLPFVLVLIDYWPLKRLVIGKSARDCLGSNYLLILEKVPLLLLSGLSVYMSSASVQKMNNIISLESVDINLRIFNALISYPKYLAKMLWPSKLAVFYPYPNTVPPWQLIGASVLLTGITIVVIWWLRRYSYLMVGWLWFIGTMVPVIGLVQVGLWPAIADRWAYVPFIGLFIIVAWGGKEVVCRWQIKPIFIAFGAAILLLALMIVSRNQVGFWANSITLYSHTLRVTENNFRMHNNLALALADAGRYEQSLLHMRAALEQKPNNPDYINNLGYVLMEQGRYEEAIRNFERAIKLDPRKWSVHQNFATVLMRTGQASEAISHYYIALDLAPNNKNVLNDLANAMVRQGRITDAILLYSKALSRDPHDPEIHNNYGVALIQMGRFKKAIYHFRRALQLNQGYVDARENLDRALKLQQGLKNRNA